MSENVSAFYPNAVCFDDKRTIKLLSNWFDSEYSNIFISLDECKPTEYKKCKDPSEIATFMSETIFYVVTQKTTVDKDIYEDNSDPHFTDEDGYFPLNK